MADMEDARKMVTQRISEPTTDPVHAGVVGAVTATLSVVFFCIFANVPSDHFPKSIDAVAILGFIIPFFYFRSKHNFFTREVVRQYMRLEEAEKSAKRT